MLAAPSARDKTASLDLRQNLLLPSIELSLDSGRNALAGPFGCLYAVVVAVGAGESDDEVAVLFGKGWGVETVVQHGVTHAGEAAAALFHELEGGERLGDDGVAGAGAVVAFAKFGEGQRRGRVARAGHNDAVGEDLHGGFAAGVLIIAVGYGVDEGFAERVDGVFVEREVVDTDHAGGMKRVFLDESQDLPDRGQDGGAER